MQIFNVNKTYKDRDNYKLLAYYIKISFLVSMQIAGKSS